MTAGNGIAQSEQWLCYSLDDRGIMARFPIGARDYHLLQTTRLAPGRNQLSTLGATTSVHLASRVRMEKLSLDRFWQALRSKKNNKDPVGSRTRAVPQLTAPSPNRNLRMSRANLHWSVSHTHTRARFCWRENNKYMKRSNKHLRQSIIIKLDNFMKYSELYIYTVTQIKYWHMLSTQNVRRICTGWEDHESTVYTVLLAVSFIAATLT
jgi:hypothetical protein